MTEIQLKPALTNLVFPDFYTAPSFFKLSWFFLSLFSPLFILSGQFFKSIPVSKASIEVAN